jgi:hypothetical protein
VDPFTDFRNRISAVCNLCMSLLLIVQHLLPYRSIVGIIITW